MSVSAQIRIRRDTAANFTSANPTLALGEIAYETDTKRFKVGDGTTAWTSLGYAAQNPTSLTVTDSTASTSTTTGALRVTGGVGVGGALNVGGGMTVTPNATAPTSNVTIGTSAGIAISGATNNVLIGAGAGDTITGSNGSVAIGNNALGAQVDGAQVISNTVAGTLSTVGPQTGVQLVKDSGVGEMAVYPIVTLTVAAGGNVTAVSVESLGSGATVPSGIVFRTDDARIDPAWRGTLESVTANTAVGWQALQSNTTGNFNSAVGLQALQSNTTGNFNSAVGLQALQSNTTVDNNSAMGARALRNNTTGTQNSAVGSNALSGNTTGSINCAVGMFALTSNTTGSLNSAVGANALFNNTTGNFNSAVGWQALQNNTTGTANSAMGAAALFNNTTGSQNSAVGVSAGRFRGTGTDTVTVATSSVFIGFQSRAAGDSQTNQVVIGGVDAVGDGSNTTVLGNSSTTSTRIAGTATSVLRVSGDTVRIDNARTPATAGAAGNAGDICWDANYIYVCVAANTWKRVAIATWP